MATTYDAVAGMIRHRLKEQNKNYICFTVGETGSGKSRLDLALAEKVDPTFNAENCRVAFKAVDFMRMVKSAKKYQAIVFEEAGVAISVREWQSKINKIMGAVGQIFRELNLCVFFNVPSMAFVDKQIKIVSHAIIHTQGIDYKQNVTRSRYWVVHHDPVRDITNLEYLELTGENGERWVIDNIYTPMPSPELDAVYAKMKREFNQNYYDKALEELERIEQGISDNKKRILVLENKEQVLSKVLPIAKQEYTWEELETICGVSARQMQRWAQHDKTTPL